MPKVLQSPRTSDTSVIIEHQSSHLNALTRRLVLLRRIGEGSMRHLFHISPQSLRSTTRSTYPPSSAIFQRVKALNQHDLIRRLTIIVIPFVRLVRLNRICLALPIRIDQWCANEVTVWNRMCVGNCQRVLEDLLDWTPDLRPLALLHGRWPECLR